MITKMNNQINSPMGQLAQMYSLIETQLRRATQQNRPVSLTELNNVPEIKEKTKSNYQVRDCVGSLKTKGHVIQSGTGRSKSYIWNTDSPSFVLRTKQRANIATQPSAPVLSKPDPKKLPKQEYELVIGSTLLTIGKNPTTGNMRIVIEEIK